MMSQRLNTALDEGVFAWPDHGPVLLARVSAHLSGAVPVSDCVAAYGFYPEARAWREAGVRCEPVMQTGFSAALIALTKTRTFNQRLIAQVVEAVEPGGLIAVDGAKTDGIDPMARALRSLFDPVDVISKAHGKFAVFRRPVTLPEVISDWAALKADSPEGWHTDLGGFSAGKIDAGSALLAETLPVLNGAVADLGAGWGYLARAALAQKAVSRLDLVEAEFATLEMARRNVADPRARFYWADARDFGDPATFDAVIANPPFHQGRASDPGLGLDFIRSAARLLKAKGTLALVANRHLPYERGLASAFARVTTVAEAKGFKIFHAQGTKRA